MQKSALIGALAGALVLGASAVSQARPRLPSAESAAATAELPNLTRYDDWLIISEQGLYLPVIDELGDHLRAAELATRRHQPQAAAVSLRRASTLLRSLPDVSGKAGRDAREATARELDSAAEELERGIIDPKRLAASYRRAIDTDVAQYWSHVSFEQWQPISGRSARHVDRATSELRTEPRAAAEDLRKAQAYLRLEELRHPAFLLRRAEHKLGQLADGVEKGRITQPDALEVGAAATEQALAQVHYEDALTAWKNHEEARAKQELRAMSEHLNRAAARANTELKAAVDSLDRMVSDAKASLADTFKRAEDAWRRLRGRALHG